MECILLYLIWAPLKGRYLSMEQEPTKQWVHTITNQLTTISLLT